eukprot:2919520-Rhodomonas_salina.2
MTGWDGDGAMAAGLIDFERSPAEKGEHIDWTEYAHDWKIEDLKNKKNPQALLRSLSLRTLAAFSDPRVLLRPLVDGGGFGRAAHTRARHPA